MPVAPPRRSCRSYPEGGGKGPGRHGARGGGEAGGGGMPGGEEGRGGFAAVPTGASPTAFADAYMAGCLAKWDLQRGMRYQEFRYTGQYHRMAVRDFLRDFFSDPEVQEHFRVLGRDRDWVAPRGTLDEADGDVVPANLTSMAFFDRLETADPPIVRANGDLVKCFDNFIDGVQISDLLRDALLNPESEHAELFGEEEKDELLYRIFFQLVLGGGLSQFEDSITAYLECTKRCYKQLLTVYKNPQHQDRVEVASAVYSVRSARGDGWNLFPKPSRQNFCFLAVDPHTHVCRVWYHAGDVSGW